MLSSSGYQGMSYFMVGYNPLFFLTYTGGRAAEEVIFKVKTSGASNDIEMATKIARAMVTRFGMDEDFGMVALETVTNQYLGGDSSPVIVSFLRRYSDISCSFSILSFRIFIALS